MQSIQYDIKATLTSHALAAVNLRALQHEKLASRTEHQRLIYVPPVPEHKCLHFL
ncbi:unnamed protein product [Callosobruchus maculatus]|uniref:Uncharacterized protein n=1 Tax=Callosobruchus maculatus TaxID=64391 RepID=A0A653CHX4_CALMS|nr:unnamed protein product [Callosobruchus maculatus]